jgi:hypothetical protein
VDLNPSTVGVSGSFNFRVNGLAVCTAAHTGLLMTCDTQMIRFNEWYKVRRNLILTYQDSSQPFFFVHILNIFSIIFYFNSVIESPKVFFEHPTKIIYDFCETSVCWY